MSTIRTEGKHTAAFILSEGNGEITREQITVAAGDALPPGTVLGILTDSGQYAPHDAAGEDGSEIAAGILYAGIDASAAPRPAVAVVRLAEVKAEELTGLTDAARADLKTRNIIVR